MKHSSPDSLKHTPSHSVFPELEPTGVGGTKARGATAQQAHAQRAAMIMAERGIKSLGGHVKATTVSFSTMHEYGDLVVNYMRARKKVFIDELKWDMRHTEGMEFDQYDTPECKWLITHEYGEILGGMRLAPTTAKCGIYSYMLRDAQRGLLPDIPTDVMFIDAPVHATVWEGTRLFISDQIPAARRMGIQMLMMRHLLTTSRDLGVSHLIGFVPSHWYRWIRRLDLHAIPIGPKITIDGVVSQAALMKVLQFVN